MEARVLSLSERRLVRHFRRAALQHIRRELRDAVATLREAEFLSAGQADLAEINTFVREWSAAVETERQGLPPPSAPAAWVHLAQELASVRESGGDWVGYLESRWRIDAGRIGWSRRLWFAALGTLAFGMSGLIALVLARHAVAGSWDGFAVGAMGSPREKAFAFALIFGRVAGTALMAEQGYRWGRRALSGRAEEPRALFLSPPDGPGVAEPPSL